MQELTPGFLCDLFVLRRNYDDEQHGIRRETDDHDLSAEDDEYFDRLEKEQEKEGGRKNAKGN